jgi:hypothetical protein
MPERGPRPISDLFAKYKKSLVAPEAAVIRETQAVISELLGITIKESQLRYTPSTRTLHIPQGMLRSEVLSHRTEILAHLKTRLGEKSAPTELT